MVELDYTNVLDTAVGAAHGIPKIAFEKAASSSKHLTADLDAARKAGTFGFVDLPFDEVAIKEVTGFAREHAYGNIVVIGIGGSALGPAALESALAAPKSGKRLVVLDNIDPDFIYDSLESIDPQETFVNVIAKSGVTAETMSTFAVVRKWMTDALGAVSRECFQRTT